MISLNFSWPYYDFLPICPKIDILIALLLLFSTLALNFY